MDVVLGTAIDSEGKPYTLGYCSQEGGLACVEEDETGVPWGSANGK